MARRKQLSKTGVTTFKVQNIDWAFLMQALENYKEVLTEADEKEFKMITRAFALDATDSLLETFNVEIK